MCVSLTERVYKTGTDATARTVLAYLAHRVNHAKPDKGCWPSVGRIAKDTGLNPRTVQKALRRLEDDGHITRLPGDRRVTVYIVHPKPCSAKEELNAQERRACARQKTPERGSPHPRTTFTPTPEPHSPKPEETKKETGDHNAKRRRKSMSIGGLLQASPIVPVREAAKANC